MYTIKHIENKKEWEAFVKKQTFPVFVQSYHYGEFYEAIGEKSFILGVYKEDTLVGGSLVVSVHAKRGDFLYLPYGPIIDYQNKEITEHFFSHIKKIAKKEGYDFIRVSPLIDDTKEHRDILKRYGCKKAPMHVLAETSWLLDTTPDEDVLLQSMKKNHRNLIRRCIREKVQIEASTDDNMLDALGKTLDEAAKRHNFSRFPQEYIVKEFNEFKKEDQAVVYKATLPNGEVDAVAIAFFYGNMAVYRHSGSFNKDKRLPTSYLIQWEIIKEAKKRGIKWYNFWGIAPEGAKKTHPFFGFTHFKKGFGGEKKDIMHCHDIPITKKYWLNWIVETIRRKKRGF
ncbi:peptidoglycan bridge formation glycyltransferase FemA/FemB family protein [Candidatus Peregrinibacteria bacterium]|jgi:lipid II:glycine glycyltransferase (peptidoglycan interpeptide bridge formation enzyme)|nr:peptidoglycan bridge formation glycyltransferase FemA/FemB family protein [Candidatus Magasanikbacteria bacterium]MBT4936408.1 peptidoglycan bridge formation glycyltransferase FemA/FemB family protein [Candidatus Peregrinibacteria bacterium]MBT4221328.1 peptidoglycan bridge formation glycyltransferase FemA/FemB family protein [Candidatus Magasanikbacteria bacterium]MBT4350824.1 peptidoglycan bridge formation glycyltransferase FemA/FemB family protein [Candidatus Magasanikbacteria bacterium]M